MVAGLLRGIERATFVALATSFGVHGYCKTASNVPSAKQVFRRVCFAALAIALLAVIAPAASGSAAAAAVRAKGKPEKVVEIDIPALPLTEAISQLMDQMLHLRAFEPVRSDNPIASRIRTNPVKGRFTADQALRRMLRGTGVTYRLSPTNFLTLTLPDELPKPPRRPDERQDLEEVQIVSSVAPEAVLNSPSLNNRPLYRPDGVTARTVFEEAELEATSYRTVGEFLRAMLPSHVEEAVATGPGVIAGEGRQLNVLGMGTSHTVVLIDGQPRAEVSAGGVQLQSGLDRLMLSSVERIEVLTGTGSSFEGGGALASVINIIRRRSNAGTNVTIQGDHFAGMPVGAFFMEGEHVLPLTDRGWLSFAGGLTVQENVLLHDRNFLTEGRARAAANNPSLLARTPPPLGRGVNVRTEDGGPILPGGSASFLNVPDGWTGDLSQLQSHEGRYDYNLANSAQDLGGARATVQAHRRHEHLNIAGKFDFSEKLLADIDVGFSREIRRGNISVADDAFPRTYGLAAAANPFGKDIIVTQGSAIGDGVMTNEQQATYAAGGLSWLLGKGKAIRALHTFSRAKAQSTLPVLRPTGETPIAGGLLDLPRLPYALDSIEMPKAVNQIHDTVITFSSPIFRRNVAGRADPALSVSAQHRHQSIDNAASLTQSVVNEGAGTETASTPRRSQNAYSLMGAFNLPVYLTDSRDPTLEAELSVRSDSYGVSLPEGARRTAHFESLNETISLGWRPSRWVLVRAGYGTGFLPPALALLTSPVDQQVPQLGVFDPLRNGELLGSLTIVTGGSLELRPEEARTYRAGFVVKSPSDSWRVSVDYTRIFKRNVVLGPDELFYGNPNRFLELFPERVRREATSDGSPGRIIWIDSSALNVARQDLRAFELSSSWKWSFLSQQALALHAYGTYVPSFKRQIAAGAEEVEHAGVGLGPPRFRASASAVYGKGAWQVGLTSRFTSSYRVSQEEAILLSQGADKKVSAQHYHDLFVSYETPAYFNPEMLLTFRLDVRNVFRQNAPFDASEVYYESRYGADELPLYRLSFGLRF